MTTAQHITVAFSTHRPETLPFAEEQMALYDAIFLEEPPVPEFFPMLDGLMAIDDYVALSETEYPEFTGASCKLLRRLYKSGKRIFQVEPYLETLLRIHDDLASGAGYKDFDPASDKYQVYQCEKQTTCFLMDFYKTSVQGSFTQTVEAVRHFAGADARRLLLRDQMRADALFQAINGSVSSAYIEAGEMHYALWRFLKQRFQPGVDLEKKYLMGTVVRSICGKDKITGPGDQLTLRCIINPDSDTLFDSLLAARALIYNKVLEKSEITDPGDVFPHTSDEVAVITMVRCLSFEDCRMLFEKIRLLSTKNARKLLVEFFRINDNQDP